MNTFLMFGATQIETEKENQVEEEYMEKKTTQNT